MKKGLVGFLGLLFGAMAGGAAAAYVVGKNVEEKTKKVVEQIKIATARFKNLLIKYL